MTKVIEIDFDEDDDVEHEPIELHVPWRNGDQRGSEVFYARPMVPLGVLWRLETQQDASVLVALVAAALRDDDYDVETLAKDEPGRGKKGDEVPVEATSSIDRWNALIDDFDRRPPNKAISKIIRRLVEEYANRTNPEGAAQRPTGPSGPSSVRRLPTGRSSTGGRSGRASTSGASKRQRA